VDVTSKSNRDHILGREIVHHSIKPLLLMTFQYVARSLKKIFQFDKELPLIIKHGPTLKSINDVFDWEIENNLKENDKKIKDFYLTVKDLLLVILAKDEFYRESFKRMAKKFCESKCLSDVPEET
jgi:hypothetical protein